jgi:hypothetical protein
MYSAELIEENMRRKGAHNSHGVTLVEFAAALVVGLPLVMIMLYAILEANFWFTIQSNLDAAARRGAWLEAQDFAKNGPAQNDVIDGAGSQAFDIPHFVNRNLNQFSIVWETSTAPHSVTVYCTYPQGGNSTYNLPRFPYPDVFNLGSSFKLQSMATYPLQPEQ